MDILGGQQGGSNDNQGSARGNSHDSQAQQTDQYVCTPTACITNMPTNIAHRTQQTEQAQQTQQQTGAGQDNTPTATQGDSNGAQQSSVVSVLFTTCVLNLLCLTRKRCEF